MNQQDRRPSVSGGGETAPVTDDKQASVDATPVDFEGLEYQASLFLLRKTEDELHAALSALEVQKSLALTATSALAAERDRADRAEARLADVNATVEKFAGRKYDAEVQPHGDPEYWRGAEHAQDYIAHRLRTALGNAEATA